MYPYRNQNNYRLPSRYRAKLSEGVVHERANPRPRPYSFGDVSRSNLFSSGLTPAGRAAADVGVGAVGAALVARYLPNYVANTKFGRLSTAAAAGIGAALLTDVLISAPQEDAQQNALEAEQYAHDRARRYLRDNPGEASVTLPQRPSVPFVARLGGVAATLALRGEDSGAGAVLGNLAGASQEAGKLYRYKNEVDRVTDGSR